MRGKVGSVYATGKHEGWRRLDELNEVVFERRLGTEVITIERIVIRNERSSYVGPQGWTWYAQRKVGAGLMVVRTGSAPTVDTCWMAAIDTVAELAFEDVAHLMVGG